MSARRRKNRIGSGEGETECGNKVFGKGRREILWGRGWRTRWENRVFLPTGDPPSCLRTDRNDLVVRIRIRNGVVHRGSRVSGKVRGVGCKCKVAPLQEETERKGQRTCTRLRVWWREMAAPGQMASQ